MAKEVPVVGERRARTTTTGDPPASDTTWTIQQWDGSGWVDIAVVRGEAERDAVLGAATDEASGRQ